MDQKMGVLALIALFIGHTMRGTRKFSQMGPTLTTFFLVGEGREDPNTTISELSSACQ